MLPEPAPKSPDLAAASLAALAAATAQALALAAENARAAQQQLDRVAEAATEAGVARIRGTVAGL